MKIKFTLRHTPGRISMLHFLSNDNWLDWFKLAIIYYFNIVWTSIDDCWSINDHWKFVYFEVKIFLFHIVNCIFHHQYVAPFLLKEKTKDSKQNWMNSSCKWNVNIFFIEINTSTMYQQFVSIKMFSDNFFPWLLIFSQFCHLMNTVVLNSKNG